MKADNQQNRNHKPLHLVDTEPAQIVSDRICADFLLNIAKPGNVKRYRS